MTWHHIAYFVSIIITAAVMGFIAWYSRRNRDTVAGAGVYMWIAFLVSLLSIFQGISMIGPAEEWALFWFNMRIACFAAIPVLWLVFVLHYIGKQGLLSKGRIILLLVIPFITQVMLWTNNWHGLWVVRDVGFSQSGPFYIPHVAVRVPGLWYKVHYIYTYGLMLAGLFILFVMSGRLYRQYRGQAVAIGIGTLVMVIGALFSSFNLVPAMDLNILPQSFAIGSIIIAWNIFRYRFLELTPRIDPDKRIPMPLIALFVVMATCIIIAGFVYYNQYREQRRVEVEQQLTSIADLKVNELVQWRRERLGDGETLHGNPAFNGLAWRLFTDPEDSGAQRVLQSWFEKIKSAYRYDHIVLLDAQGVPRMSVPSGNIPDCGFILEHLAEVRQSGNVRIIDFHRDAPDKPIHLSVVVPVMNGESGNSILGFVVLFIDPAMYLYPLINRWPTPSRSAETLLVRREGNDALFLNELRFRKNTALNMRIPLRDLRVPAVRAALGLEGPLEGIDYRGVPVVAIVRAVPESPWYMVARIDIAEVYASVRERFWAMVILVMILVVVTGAGVGILWRRQGERFIRERLDAAEALRESERKLKEAQEMAHLGHWNWDVKTGDVEWSEEVYKIFRLDPKKFTPRIDSILAFSPWPEDHERDKELINRAIESHASGSYEQKFLRPDKSIGWYYSNFQGNYNEKGELVSIVGTVIDITGRKQTEQTLREINDRLSMSLDVGNAGVWEWNILNDTVRFDDRFHALLGYTQGELPNTLKEWMLYHYPEDIPVWMPKAEAYLRGDSPQYESEHRIHGKSGNWEWVFTRGKIVKTTLTGSPELFVGIAMNITERKRAEELVRASEVRYRRLFEASKDAIIILDAETGMIVDVNPFLIEMLGFSHDQFLGKTIWDIGLFKDIIANKDKFLELQEKKYVRYEGLPLETADGRRIDAEFTSNFYEIENKKLAQCNIRDISERVRIQKTLNEISSHQKSLLTAIPDIIMEVDANKVYSWANGPGIEFFGDDVVGREAAFYFEGEQNTYQSVQPIFNGDEDVIYLESWQRRRDGEKRLLAWWCSVLKDESGKVTGALSSARDITELKRVEDALRESKDELQRLLESMTSAFVLFESVFADDGRFVSYRFVYINESYERITGVKNDEVKGKTVHEVWPNTEPEWIKRYGEVAVTGVSQTFDMYHETTSKHYHCNVYRPGDTPDRFCVIFEDITELKRAEDERKHFIVELERSNVDLQQFAYVASHDLQEPLRMISSYLQLIERRYKDKLDQDANDFINYAVNGAIRLQALISGLLDFSRVRTHGKPFESVNVYDVLDEVRKDLEMQIAESGAMVTFADMPVVRGDGVQIARLFQNLVQNAIKFRREGTPPLIDITADKSKDEYIFCVRDNGIGMEEKYLERIFVIFQRLHSREEYPGTGIGLSICKRIVERHGGRIWVESKPGEGSAFYFSILAASIKK